MSKCRVRLILWLLLAGVSIGGGIVIDVLLKTRAFPVFVRLLGLVGMLAVHFPLKRTGRLLRRMENPQEWGCTTRLVTTDIYQCVRHPHHAAVGTFMTCLGLLIGHPGSFLLIMVTQWIWVIGFLFLVEEKELMEKFGEEYKAYRQQVPMLIANPFCLIRVLLKPSDLPKS